MSDDTIRLELRVTPELMKRIDDFRRQLPSPPARATAARMLIEYALDGTANPTKRTTVKRP